MKTRLGALMVLVATLWGCGDSPNLVTNPNPPADHGVTPVVTPVHLDPTPTPGCPNFKLCQDQ